MRVRKEMQNSNSLRPRTIIMPMLASVKPKQTDSGTVDNWLGNKAREIIDRYRNDNITMEDLRDEIYDIMKCYNNIIKSKDKKYIYSTNSKHNNNNEILYLHDSGSNAYLTNDKSLYIPDTLTKCNVNIYGIDGSNRIHKLHSKVCGNIKYNFNNGTEIILREVLCAPDASIGGNDKDLKGDVKKPGVLVSTSKLTHDFDIDVKFLAGGRDVELIKKGEVIHKFHSSKDNDGLYIDEVRKKDRKECNVLSLNTDDFKLEELKERIDILKSENKREEDSDKDEPNSSDINDEKDIEIIENINEINSDINRGKDSNRREEKDEQVQSAKVLPKRSREKRRLEKLLHGRLHFGKTQHIIQALREAYGDKCDRLFDDNYFHNEPCDACVYAKAKVHPISRKSMRQAKRVGQRLHYDVFISPYRSDTRCKYLLLVIDEYSNYRWAFGLRKRSEVMIVLKNLIVRLERLLSKRVEYIYRQNDDSLLDDKVASVRCDNAGENVLEEMRDWCRRRGTAIETTIAHTPHQNGRAERAGGVVWKGAAALRYAAKLPEKYWLYCILAYVHMMNRLPTSSKRLGKRTPYEDLNNITIPQLELIKHFRTIGSLCYIVKPHNEIRIGKPKLAYKAMMLCYADHDDKKGYIVQKLDDGSKHYVPYERLYKCYENIMIFDVNDDEDAYIKREVRKYNNKKRNKKYKISNNDYDESNDNENSKSESLSSSDSDRSVEGGGSDVSVDVEGLEDGSPPRAATPPPRTRSQVSSHLIPPHNMPDVLSPLLPARAPNDVSTGENKEDQAAEADTGEKEAEFEDTNFIEEKGKDDDKTDEDKTDEDEYEVIDILSYRKVGKKRNRIEYLTEWKGGETSWEPSSTFRLTEVDNETGSHYLPVYENFREKMRKKEVDEYKEKKESEFKKEEEEEYIKENIRIYKSVVKGGVVVPENRKQAKKLVEWPHFKEAELKELKSFKDHKVWVLVPPSPRIKNVIGTRWVYDIKLDKDFKIVKYKARLVAQGFSQKEGIDYTETFAPTMHIKTLRVLLALAAKNNYDVIQYDVSTAFLHAALDRVAYVKQPPGHKTEGKEDWIYKLDKAMYGLKNAPKAYSDHFMAELTKLGFIQSKKDECLWSLRVEKSFVHLLFHVDDIIVVSNDKKMRVGVELVLGERIDLKCEGEPKMFLNVAIERLENNSFSLSQEHYIEKMAERFGVLESKVTGQPCVYGEKLSADQLPKTVEEKAEAKKLPFQALVGSLIYVSKTRPDVAYAISNVARFMSEWGLVHFKSALRILRYLYQTKDRKHIITPSNNMILYAYADANWKDERESTNVNECLKWKSQYGFLVFVGDSLVSWVSKRQASRTHSSMEAEYYAADECAKEILWFKGLFLDLDIKTDTTPIYIYEDNNACISFSKNNTCHSRTKHIDLRIHCLRDYVRDGIIKLIYVPTAYQLADMLTKAQLKPTFIDHVEKIFSTGEKIPPASSCTLHVFVE